MRRIGSGKVIKRCFKSSHLIQYLHINTLVVQTVTFLLAWIVMVHLESLPFQLQE